MKDFLAESLELLMQEKPFDKITIKQICDRAGVIRATFYNHFEDKYAALDYIADELLHEEQKVFVASKDIVHVILSLCEMIYDHRAFFQRAFQVQGQNDFDNMFTRHIAQLIEELLGGVRDDDAIRFTATRRCLCILPMPSCICARNGCGKAVVIHRRSLRLTAAVCCCMD